MNFDPKSNFFCDFLQQNALFSVYIVYDYR